MIDTISSSATAQTVALLTCYSFEIQTTAQETVARWLSLYSITWIRLAVVEALYLGRYKAISVEQILSSWSRKENPTVHFSHDFERLICRNLPRHLATPLKPSANKNERTSSHKPTSQSKLAPKPQALPPQITTPISFKLQPKSPKSKPAPKPQALPPQITTPISHQLQPKSPAAQASVNTPKKPPSGASERSINQFTPSLETSEFYVKLKAVAQTLVKQ